MTEDGCRCRESIESSAGMISILHLSPLQHVKGCDIIVDVEDPLMHCEMDGFEEEGDLRAYN